MRSMFSGDGSSSSSYDSSSSSSSSNNSLRDDEQEMKSQLVNRKWPHLIFDSW